MRGQTKNPNREFTKECLYEALMILAGKKRITDISVRELTEKAGVSRMTFYRNYLTIMDIIIEHLDQAPLGYEGEVTEEQYNMHEHCYRIFEYFKHNEKLIQYLLRDGQLHFLEDLIDRHVKTTFRPVQAPYGFIEEHEISALSGMCTMLIVDWMRSGMVEDPKIRAEKMIAVLDTFNKYL